MSAHHYVKTSEFSKDGSQELDSLTEGKSLPAAIFYRDDDPTKRQLYDQFKEMYSGEPLGNSLPTIIRRRGGKEILFDNSILSGVTPECSHMIHVRQALNSPGAQDLAFHEKFFVATTDFGFKENTEWYVHPSSSLTQVSYSYYGPPRYKLELILTKEESALEESSDAEDFQHSSWLEKIKSKCINENMERLAHANDIAFTLDEIGELSWGNYRFPITFIGLHEIESQIWAMRRAEQLGKVGLSSTVVQPNNAVVHL